MSKTGQPDDLEILEDLKNRLYSAILNDEPQPKVGDLLKVIEMKRKLSVEGRGEKKFWAMVNKLREKELSRENKAGRRKKSPAKQTD
jgi:hypothetical protein